MYTSRPTRIVGSEEIEIINVRKKFLTFPIMWRVQSSTKHIGNDIFIKTDHPIRNVYINGKLLNNRE